MAVEPRPNTPEEQLKEAQRSVEARKQALAESEKAHATAHQALELQEKNDKEGVEKWQVLEIGEISKDMQGYIKDVAEKRISLDREIEEKKIQGGNPRTDKAYIDWRIGNNTPVIEGFKKLALEQQTSKIESIKKHQKEHNSRSFLRRAFDKYYDSDVNSIETNILQNEKHLKSIENGTGSFDTAILNSETWQKTSAFAQKMV